MVSVTGRRESPKAIIKHDLTPPYSGRFLHNDLIPKNLKLEDTVTVLEGNEKQLFLDFAKKMLRWLPEERQSAAELLHDPWLRSNLPQK